MPGAYHFKTRWRIAAPVSAVYKLIQDAEAWPLWWPAVRSVKVSTAKDGAEIQRQVWGTPLGYSFDFELRLLERKTNQLLRAAASGMLEGTGEWRFREMPEGCLVTFEWNVKTNIPWMKSIAWLMRPVFAYNHHLVMEQGRKGLMRLIHCQT